MKKIALCLLSAALALVSLAEIKIENSAKDNIARIGDKVVFKISGAPDGARFEFKVNGKQIEKGICPEEFSYTPDKESWLIFSAFDPNDKDKNGHVKRKENGVIVSPDKVKTVTQAPKDLDKFWKKIKMEVERNSPRNAKLEKLRDFPAENGKYAVELYRYEIKVDDGENGSCDGGIADGYLALPVGKKGKMPIVATFFGAGSFSADLRPAVEYAKEGAIGVSMNPHSIPPSLKGEERQKFIDEVVHQKGVNYKMRNKDKTPEEMYFVGMFKRVYQTLRMAMARPEWDGKNIATTGFSQGGSQTIVAAYLCPKVTVIAPLCPAMCDNGAGSIGRRSGWPDWVNNANQTRELENGRYFDPALMAQFIRAKMYVGIGLCDNTCTPTAVTAMFNNFKGKKDRLYMQGVGHGWNDDWSKNHKDFILKNIGLKK